MKKRFDLDTALKVGIAAIILAVPIYPKFPFLRVPGIYVSIRLEDFLILAVTLLWFVKVIPNLKSFWANNVVRAVVLFLAVSLVSTLSAIFLTHTVLPNVAILQWGRRVEYLMCFFIALTSLKNQKDLEFYMKCVGIVILVVTIFGLGQKYLTWPVITTQNEEYSKGIALRYVQGGHLASTFAGHYDLATYIILTSPIFAALLFMKREFLEKFIKGNEKLVRGIILSILIMSFWLLVNAASRISAVSYIVSVSLTLFLIRKYKFIPLIVVTTFLFILLTSNLLNRYVNILDVLLKKMTLIKTAFAEETQPSMPVPLQDLSTSIRTNVEWPRAIRAFMKNPLLGTGYSSITLATDSDYLRALGETGILGVISIVFVFYRVIKKFLSQLPFPKEIDFRTAYLAGLIGAIPGLLMNALFIDIFEASKFAIIFWLMIGFGVALIVDKQSLKNEL